VDNLSMGISGDQVEENGPFAYQPAQAHWVGGASGGATDTADQFAKLGVVDASPHPFGFMFRVNGTDREHYEVHLRPDLPEWRWERYGAASGLWDGTLSSCAAEALSDGDFIGATVEGTGPATTVSVWRWDADPGTDLATWGPPDCVMTAGSGDFVDSGNLQGIRAYAASAQNHAADDWCAGDVSAVSGP
jgi:hypothetical protein